MTEPPQPRPLKAAACTGCTTWEEIGEKCWYFWENKKHCTQHSDVRMNI